jgi:hypothetical protein
MTIFPEGDQNHQRWEPKSNPPASQRVGRQKQLLLPTRTMKLLEISKKLKLDPSFLNLQRRPPKTLNRETNLQRVPLKKSNVVTVTDAAIFTSTIREGHVWRNRLT